MEDQEILYAQYNGSALLNPKAKDLTQMANRCASHLDNLRRQITLDDADVRLWGDDRRRAAQNSMKNAMSSASMLLRELRDQQAFLKPAAIATLRAWGKLPDATLKISVNFDRGSLTVGRSDLEVQRIVVGDNATNVLRDLPSFGIG